MTKNEYNNLLTIISSNDLCKGIEKESLRIDQFGFLSQNPHPPELGSALTHPNVTTDFSESQLELITGKHNSTKKTLNELELIHKYVLNVIGDEILWCSSMPGPLPVEKNIPIGKYGNSNIGKIKTVYRNGLANRYGKKMQTISGVHYNFSISDDIWRLLNKTKKSKSKSLQEFKNEGYLHLIRNFRKNSWILTYLFGASPIVCKDFVQGRVHNLIKLSENHLYAPYGTSLRMSSLGYQSEAQSSLTVSYNNLESYCKSLQKALVDPYKPYSGIGIKNKNEYLQLSTSLLQIENEYYSSVRPKRTINSGERPLHAITERGIEYIELRSIDLNPFQPYGIDGETINFIDIFLLYCLLDEKINDSILEIKIINNNNQLVAEHGRDPDLKLFGKNGMTSIKDWSLRVINRCYEISESLDKNSQKNSFYKSVVKVEDMLRNPEKTLSEQMINNVSNFDNSFTKFSIDQSKKNKKEILKNPLKSNLINEFSRIVSESIEKQKEIEKLDRMSFEEFRLKYINQKV